MTAPATRVAANDDAGAISTLYARSRLPGAPRSAAAFQLLLQTGHAFLVAERDEEPLGAVRYWSGEGIGWFDILVSARPWAGARLVRAVERLSQDNGIRLVRCRCPDVGIYEDYFARLGYLPIGRGKDAEGEPELLLERRLPLLTVREQRRADAEAIGRLTGEDPWVFEQGARPGIFVAADGEKVIGLIQVSAASRGVANLSVPVLSPSHRGRGIELWMIARAAEYAETNGYHTAEIEAAPSLDEHRKGLEAAYWTRDGALWRRIFFTPRTDDDDDP